ncbi:MerR family transcriptional regulator [Variovorax sp. OV084]|jgi:DNA-binding transcriptional MerR regulator|uniref:MerR family transcriptional regulator n=1 Tax=unclassified Variovorax TaxID=663243 RepID=UPI0008B946DF|nr:MerR family transcriptional regulator [Variovorax sp. OV084]SEU22480.1 DNA-binding transcriptional regulator, MerR family [Variovorax sp. OV084]
MKIGELAAATGVAPSAIRFYEKSGLLPAARRGSNGYRSYSNDAIERLRLIQVAQSLGFSLDTLGGVFASAEGFRKDELMRNLDVRLAEIDGLMSTLRLQRRELRDLRETLRSSWAAGDCVDAVALAKEMSAKPAPMSRRLTIRSSEAR